MFDNPFKASQRMLNFRVQVLLQSKSLELKRLHCTYLLVRHRATHPINSVLSILDDSSAEASQHVQVVLSFVIVHVTFLSAGKVNRIDQSQSFVNARQIILNQSAKVDFYLLLRYKTLKLLYLLFRMPQVTLRQKPKMQTTQKTTQPIGFNDPIYIQGYSNLSYSFYTGIYSLI